MDTTAKRKKGAPADDDIGRDIRLELFRMQLELRLCEKRADDLFLQNLIKGTSHLSLGQEAIAAAFGVAISAAIFTALRANNESITWLEGVITFAGRQDNLAVREAAIVALGFNVLMVVVAILSIMLTVPKGKKA